MLHVLNGDATREKLERAGVPGALTVWADVLHEGPVPDVPEAELRRIRASYLSAEYGESEEEALRDLERWYTVLDSYSEHDEVVFWYEHDLFDQLILIRHLHWLSQIAPGPTRFTMVPGRDYLGPLTPEQLATLFARRTPISREQIETGARAWTLFRAPDPRPLAEWASSGGATPLACLPAALLRYFEEFPSTRDGLSRTERQILQALAAGHTAAHDVFRASQQTEEPFFLGDATFWLIARRLAHAPQPPLAVSPDIADLRIHDSRLELTPVGGALLAGTVDHVALNGIDRWLGGVRLTPATCWRWNGASFVS